MLHMEDVWRVMRPKRWGSYLMAIFASYSAIFRSLSIRDGRRHDRGPMYAMSSGR